MPTSLAKIKSQIAKLQQQAATIETGIVARIKAEIAKHGLTVEQLFGTSSNDGVARGATKPKAVAKVGASKPAKFADGSGNTWGGMGKRPQWIRDALEAGKSLDDFLVAGKSIAAKAKSVAKVAPAKKVKTSKAVPPKKRAAVKKAASVKAAAAPAAAKKPAKTAAGKPVVKKPVKARSAAASVELAEAPAA